MSTEESVFGSEAGRDPWLSQYDDCLLDHAEDDALRKKLASGKKEILFKKVFHCHRAAKTKPVRPRKDGKPPPSSKKDICCRYEMWQVVLASDPEHTYFVEMHPHTGHDPATNPEEYRWLKTPAAIEDRVKDVSVFLLRPIRYR